MAYNKSRKRNINIIFRKRFRGNAPLSTGRYDAELARLSSGNFNVEEEQAKLETPLTVKSHASGIKPTDRTKEA